MSLEQEQKRIVGEKAAIDADAVKDFFTHRAEHAEGRDPVVTVMLQDHAPELTLSRDAHEKEICLSLMHPGEKDSVLDIGCGNGRWGMALRDTVATYVGMDPVESFIDQARDMFSGYENCSFDVADAENFPEKVGDQKFSMLIIAGVFQYINDALCKVTLENASHCAAPECRILFRVPVGIEERLTLDAFWSEELQCEYSAIYRTEAEYMALFEQTFLKYGFTLLHSAPLYPEELNNRKETRQHIFVLARG